MEDAVAAVSRAMLDDAGLSFVSLAEPSVPAALERARRLGAERIVAAPYFLFAGSCRTGSQPRRPRSPSSTRGSTCGWLG